jgi:hypothetical protein
MTTESNKQAKAAIENETEHLLKHNIYKTSNDLSKVSRGGWLRFGFPGTVDKNELQG